LDQNAAGCKLVRTILQLTAKWYYASFDSMVERGVQSFIQEMLEKKVIILSGPRQVGKTFLSKHLSKKFSYLNYDSQEDRLVIREKSWRRDSRLLILDEIHKMKNWKSFIKGIYDVEGLDPKILVTGSARLDLHKKVGDSLAGRHYNVRLNPFSIKELKNESKDVIEDMMKFGMFPEPFLSASEKIAALWRRSHLDVILRQDFVQVQSVKDLSQIEALVDLLRQRVGSSLSIKNLADELGASPHSVKNWIQLLENHFVVFVIHPYSKNIAKAIKKEPKVYFYDVGQLPDNPGARLENVVALHLLKRNQFLEDTEGKKLKLHYIRDKEKKEIDFVITDSERITHLIEVKTSDDSFNTALNYYAQKLNPKMAVQLVYNLKREKDYETFKVRELHKFLFQLEA
jgi:predicted AAA+ superfamily ATPase